MAEEKLNANDTLSKVLAYVDSPFKLFAVILMAVLAFSGWMFYDNKELLVGAYKEQQKLPQIAEGRVDDAASHLFKHTNAQVVAIFKVKMNWTNEESLVSGSVLVTASYDAQDFLNVTASLYTSASNLPPT